MVEVLRRVGEEAVVLLYRVDARHLILSRIDLIQLVLLHQILVLILLLLHVVKLNLVIPRVMHCRRSSRIILGLLFGN